ncbi:glycosyltransferase [Polynucleobacter paneuropaeus]|nr:glycosyltransferase [Polynucleobacter paneuropaeus]
MKFSIVTVVLNDALNIEKTMMSVLNQSYSDFEYIIMDGGSTDGTLDIIKLIANNDSRIKWISELDLGIYDAMNKGIRLSHGLFINFMNSGDCFANNLILSKVHSELSQNTNVSVLYGSVEVVQGEQTRVINAFPKYKIRDFLPFCHQSVFVKKEILEKYPFSLDYKYASDYNQFVLISKNKNIIWLQVDDVYSRVTEGGVADNYRVFTAREYLKIIKIHYGRINLTNWLLFFKIYISKFILSKLF